MAAQFCSQCGSEVAEGKRFCSRCGAAVKQRPEVPALTSEGSERSRAAVPLPQELPAMTIEVSSATVAGSAGDVRACSNCGSGIPHAKRFCAQCGTAVTQDLRPTAPLGAPLNDASRPSPPNPSPQQSRRVALISELSNQDGVRLASSTSAQVELAGPTMPFQRLDTQDVYQPPIRPEATGYLTSQPPDASHERKGQYSHHLPIGVAVLALILGVGAFGFYEWHKKSSGAAAVATPAEMQSSAKTAQTIPSSESVVKSDDTTPTPAPPAEASTPKVKPEVPSVPVPPASVGQKARTAAAIIDPPQNPGPDHVAPGTPAPVTNEPPATPNSGILHYSGPPVHYGDAITFRGLPAAMLRFSFDHSSWQPRISHEPDGTQTLTLRSLSHQDQTQCDVRWEVAQ
jgi:hypothetical protein